MPRAWTGIELTGVCYGQFGKAYKFHADSWDEPEFIPVSQSFWIVDPLAITEGHGTMKISRWLASKNGWTEL